MDRKRLGKGPPRRGGQRFGPRGPRGRGPGGPPGPFRGSGVARTGPLRISVVHYLNTAPLVWGFEHGEARGRFELSYTTPAGCAEALRAGAADAGIIPSIEYQRIPGLKIVPGVSIAGRERVRSVLLVSRGPARLARRVALDAHSRASAALVKILFASLWRCEPEYLERPPDLAQMLAEADAALLIGDPALACALRGPAAAGLDAEVNWHVYDLAEEWWKLTGLPFVFAFWAVRAEKARPTVARAFLESRDLGLRHLGEIARAASPELKLPGGQLERYLRENLDFRLDARHRAGLESFFRAARELGLIERVRPLEFL